MTGTLSSTSAIRITAAQKKVMSSMRVQCCTARANRRALRGSSKKLRGEFVEVIAPVNPGVAACALLVDGIETVALEQVHRLARARHQKIGGAGSEPEQLLRLLPLSVIQFSLVLLFPAGQVALEDGGAENADVGEILEVRQRDAQGLPAAHRE